MNRARVAYNFTDAHAFPDRWHRAGMRYLTFNCHVVASEETLMPTLERLAGILSPDDRFAVDLAELGTRSPGKPIWVAGYVFRHCCVDDHAFCLGSLDEAEIDEIVELLNITPDLIGYAATEVVSTETRGKPALQRRFSRRRETRT